MDLREREREGGGGYTALSHHRVLYQSGPATRVLYSLIALRREEADVLQCLVREDGKEIPMLQIFSFCFSIRLHRHIGVGFSWLQQLVVCKSFRIKCAA